MQRKGFTITELIIVITVIGILASIVIVAYNGVVNRADDSAIQSDLEAIAAQLEAYRVNPNNPSEFPHTTAVLSTLQLKASKNSYLTTNSNLVYCTNATFQTFALVAKSRSNTIFMITEGGFKTFPLANQFVTNAVCVALGLTWISSGRTSASGWQSWVNG